MGPRSSVETLPPEILSELESLWGSGRWTLDQMVARLREVGADVSRSALHRATQKWDKRLERLKAAREIARTFKNAMKDDPDGDLGQIISEQLQMMAFEMTQRLDDDEDIVLDPATMVKLAKMSRDLAAGDKLRIDRERARADLMRREFENRAKKIEDDVKVGQVTDPAEVLRRIREDVYGIFP